MGGANDDKNKQNNKQRKSRRQFDSSRHTPTRSWSSLVYQLCVIAPLIICHASLRLSCALSRDETLRNKRQMGRFAARTHLDWSQTGRGAPQVAAQNPCNLNSNSASTESSKTTKQQKNVAEIRLVGSFNLYCKAQTFSRGLFL